MNSQLTRFHVLWATCALCCLSHASGHAYMYWPASRNRIKFYYLAQSQNAPPNAGGVKPESGFSDLASKHGAPPDGRGGKRSDKAWAWDLCGQGPDPGTQKTGDSWKNWAGPPIATYKQGGKITFTMVVNGEHGGVHEFRLCPKKVDASMNIREAAECLDMYLIGRSCTPGEGCGCANDKCKNRTPHNTKEDPLYSSTIPESAPEEVRRQPDFLQFGAHQFTYTLPEGVSCDECTVQWFWATAYGEWFRNCIDIKIEGNGAPTQPPAPAPSPSAKSRRRRRSSRRRRRKSSRRRSTRRRRRKSARRRSPNVAAAAGTVNSPARNTEVDMEYDEVGCFPLVHGDAAADHLPCDCDTGAGPRLYDTLRDFTCMHHHAETACRSGLPFYRLLVNRNEADRLCFSFCSAKGADLFGLLGYGNKSAEQVECRCGATMTNYNFWKTANLGSSGSQHPSLLLDRSTKLKHCAVDSVRVYSYEGWKRFSGSSGVQEALLDFDGEDTDYMASIVTGQRVKDGKNL